MTTFQLLIIIISALTLAGSIVSVYVSMRISIARIDVEIQQMKKDFIQKEIAICKLENTNREDHQIIIDKIDVLRGLVIGKI